MDVNELVQRYALSNAVSHDGQAFSKSVLGRILSDHPALRNKVMEVKHKVELECEHVNRMTLAEQKAALAKLGELEVHEEQEEKHGLSELVGARPGKFAVRMAPNPSGALTLGHARPAILNYEYAKKYRGRFILRFDDTDPRKKIPEKQFYEWIKEDLRWLGLKWDKLIIASKRLNIYYNYTKKLLEMEKAYVCTCSPEDWKVTRNKGEECPCRSLPKKEQLKRWKKMLGKNGYKEGEAVLRIKTEMHAANPALRDWPALRIIAPEHQHHPLKKAKVWPLLDFQSAIDDKLTGITHILRGNDLQTSEKRQRYLYQHFGWEYPQTSTIGKFSLSGSVLSKSTIKEGIASGKYRGWDDTALGTLRSLKRRGFQAEAIRQLVLDIGHKTADISVSMKNLAAYNRKLIDPVAERYFFIPEPISIELDKIPVKNKAIPKHPTNKKAGVRNFVITKKLYVDKTDFDNYRGLEVRLKDLFNVVLDNKSKVTSIENKSIPKIQWVTASNIPTRVLLEERMIKGSGESNLKKVKRGQIVQFERFGFVRIEKVQPKNIVAVFAHE